MELKGKQSQFTFPFYQQYQLALPSRQKNFNNEPGILTGVQKYSIITKKLVHIQGDLLGL